MEHTVRDASEGYAYAYLRYFFLRAEAERFELSVGCPTQTFQVCALDRYATPPCI